MLAGLESDGDIAPTHALRGPTRISPGLRHRSRDPARPWTKAPPSTPAGSWGGAGAHLCSEGCTPTDSEAMAVTVSASSFSQLCASTSE